MKTKIFLAVKAFSTIYLTSLFLIFGVGYLFYNSENEIKSFISIFLALIAFLPLIFNKKIIHFYSKNTVLKMNDNKIFIEIFGKNDEFCTFKKDIDYSEIKSYIFSYASGFKEKWSVFTLILENNKKYTLRFFKSPQKDGDIDGQILLEKIHQAFTNYNLAMRYDKIIFKPSFLASKLGLYFILTFIFMLILVLIFTFKVGGNRLAFIQIVIILAILMQLIARRIKEIQFYNKMKKL